MVRSPEGHLLFRTLIVPWALVRGTPGNGLRLPWSLRCARRIRCLRSLLLAWVPPLYVCVSSHPTSPLQGGLTRVQLLALFYTREEIGLRLACYFGFAAVAGAFGGLIAFGVQHAHTTIENWRLLFLIEGFPAIAMGFIAMFALPNRPEETHIFNEDERRLALERMNRGTRADVGRMIRKSEPSAEISEAGAHAVFTRAYCGSLQGLEGARPPVIPCAALGYCWFLTV